MRFVKALLVAGVLAAVVAPSAMAFRFSDATRNTPTGVTGQPYFHAIETVAGCKGVAVKVLSGSLPPGLRLEGSKRDDVDGSDWRIVGTPTTPGEFGFWLEATNICYVGDPPEPESTQEPFMIRVVQGLAIEGPGLDVGTVGVPYPSRQFTAAGGGTHTWSATGLPAGLTLSPSGLLSGTPTEEAKSKPVAIKATDGSRTTTRNYEISIRAPLAISAVAIPPISQIGQPFKLGPLAATGGSGSYTWSIASGRLPTGITLNPTTAVIEGVPTVAGSFSIRLRVADTEGRTAEATIAIQIASPVSIVTRRFAVLRVGRFYTLAIKIKGGVFIVRNGRNTMNWKVVGGKLPLGLRLNSRVGKLIGRPRRAGVYAFSIEVTDKFRNKDVESYVLTVKKK